MWLLLGMIGVMAGLAAASYFYERRNGSSRASRGKEPASPEDGWGAEGESDFDADGDGE
jgi:hypothetical protein